MAKTNEQKAAYTKAWAAANKDRLAAKRNVWAAANRERRAATTRAWYLTNRERTLEQNRRYRAANLEHLRAKDRERRVRRIGKRERLENQGGRCPVCAVELTLDTGVVDHDHKCCPPKKGAGGANHTCGRCLRGVLRQPCNIIVGCVEKYPRLRALVPAAASYPASYEPVEG